jgi:hypothetical protein
MVELCREQVVPLVRRSLLRRSPLCDQLVSRRNYRSLRLTRHSLHDRQGLSSSSKMSGNAPEPSPLLLENLNQASAHESSVRIYVGQPKLGKMALNFIQRMLLTKPSK